MNGQSRGEAKASSGAQSGRKRSEWRRRIGRSRSRLMSEGVKVRQQFAAADGGTCESDIPARNLNSLALKSRFCFDCAASSEQRLNVWPAACLRCLHSSGMLHVVTLRDAVVVLHSTSAVCLRQDTTPTQHILHLVYCGDREMGVWMNRWIDGYMERWMERYIDG